MLRLGLMIVGTILAVILVLQAFGSGDLRAQRPQPEAEAGGPDAASLAEALFTPGDSSQPAQPEQPVVPADEVPQIAPQVERFPGPPLEPSPQYADSPPAETSSVAAAGGGTTLYITGNRVNFRSGPSTSDAVVGALNGGDPVEAIGPTDGSWVQIRDADGRTGYVSAQFVGTSQN